MSGSFRKAMVEVAHAVYDLTGLGVVVLSPADPRVVGAIGEFLFVASDPVQSIKRVQSRHLAMIAVSDFVWLCAPDGYVGVSAAMEIGFAEGKGVPVFTRDRLMDATLREFVVRVDSQSVALEQVNRRPRSVKAHDWAHASGL